VKKAAGAATTAGQLCEAIAAFIPSEPERKAFLAACAGELAATGMPPATDAASAGATAVTPAPGTGKVARAGAVTWDPVVLDRVRHALAEHIGPLARLMVQRAASTARDANELCEALARAVPAEEDRTSFLRKARRVIEGE
jgi:serine/threonine-protein kinase